MKIHSSSSATEDTAYCSPRLHDRLLVFVGRFSLYFRQNLTIAIISFVQVIIVHLTKRYLTPRGN